jgi:hypothetical protein
MNVFLGSSNLKEIRTFTLGLVSLMLWAVIFFSAIAASSSSSPLFKHEGSESQGTQRGELREYSLPGRGIGDSSPGGFRYSPLSFDGERKPSSQQIMNSDIVSSISRSLGRGLKISRQKTHGELGKSLLEEQTYERVEKGSSRSSSMGSSGRNFLPSNLQKLVSSTLSSRSGKSQPVSSGLILQISDADDRSIANVINQISEYFKNDSNISSHVIVKIASLACDNIENNPIFGSEFQMIQIPQESSLYALNHDDIPNELNFVGRVFNIREFIAESAIRAGLQYDITMINPKTEDRIMDPGCTEVILRVELASHLMKSMSSKDNMKRLRDPA